MHESVENIDDKNHGLLTYQEALQFFKDKYYVDVCWQELMCWHLLQSTECPVNLHRSPFEDSDGCLCDRLCLWNTPFPDILEKQVKSSFVWVFEGCPLSVDSLVRLVTWQDLYTKRKWAKEDIYITLKAAAENRLLSFFNYQSRRFQYEESTKEDPDNSMPIYLTEAGDSYLRGVGGYSVFQLSEIINIEHLYLGRSFQDCQKELSLSFTRYETDQDD